MTNKKTKNQRSLNSFMRIGFCCLCLLIASCKQQTAPPDPFMTIPSQAQLNWQKMEYYMFVHFGPNTFTDKEWGDGTEDPMLFNPSDLDCRQWAETALNAGMEGIIITAKHHDGFCLWPSNYSTHTVRESLWKEGKGDVLRELSDACAEYGLKFGVYVSPWDRNHPAYGTTEYNRVFANTLTEVLSNYGEVFEQWFDGANGEGPNGKKQEYNWTLFYNTVYSIQPEAILFSDVGPGCRWIGNEAGYAGETNWSRLNTSGFMPGNSPDTDTLNSGNKLGEAWIPGEVDVSIRPGWFYSASTDNKVKSAETLMDIYFASVGRNANLLLNVPPDKRGRIHPTDSLRLIEFKEAREKAFHPSNRIGVKQIMAADTRGNSSRYGADRLLDGNYDSYWAANDSVMSTYIEMELIKETDVNCILIQEYIPLGQRVARFTIEAWNSGNHTWEQLTAATTIGYKRILRFKPYSTCKLRLNIQKSLACPVLNNIEIYNIPVVYLPPEDTDTGDCEREKGDVSQVGWTVVSPETDNSSGIIDGKNIPVSIDEKKPVVIDFGSIIDLKGFYYIPEKNSSAANIYRYNLSTATDGSTWNVLASNAAFDNIKNNPIRQNVFFDQTIKARYIKLEPLETSVQSDKYVVVEVGVLAE